MLCWTNCAEFLALLFADRGTQVLDFGQAFTDEHDQGDFCHAADPGVADQLRVKSQQALGLPRVAAAGGFPLDQAACAVQIPEGIDIGHEVVPIRKLPP